MGSDFIHPEADLFDCMGKHLGTASDVADLVVRQRSGSGICEMVELEERLKQAHVARDEWKRLCEEAQARTEVERREHYLWRDRAQKAEALLLDDRCRKCNDYMQHVDIRTLGDDCSFRKAMGANELEADR